MRALLAFAFVILLSAGAYAAPELDAEGGFVEQETTAPADSNDNKEKPPAENKEPEKDDPNAIVVKSVKLRAINKITARTSVIDAQIGISANFGNLEIVARDCWKAPDTERPENAALLDIWDRRRDEKPVRVFYGWMFSSTPSISTLEHPVYDITVIECVSKKMEPDSSTSQ